jgi:3-dehydroquinate dehydratase-2
MEMGINSAGNQRMKIQIINGPNLNLLGLREPTIYGAEGFDQYLTKLRSWYEIITIDYFQSNVEGELINKLHEVGFSYDGIVLNGAGYTHTSVAIADAIAAIETPVIEVHISNIYAREEFRHVSLTGKNCKGVLTGFGLDGYRLAIESLLKP